MIHQDPPVLPLRQAQSLVFLTAVAFAFALRLASLDVRQVWLDEALTQYAVSLDWSALVADRVAAGHSPAYFVVMKALGLDGSDLRALRMASAVMDSLAAGCLAAAVTRFAGLRAGVFAALFYALNPLLLFWGQNARPYGMLMMFLAVGIYGAAGLSGGAATPAGARRDAVALSLGLDGAAATMTGGVIAAGIIALSPFASAALRRDRAFQKTWGRALILPGCCAVAMAVLISLPHAEAVQGAYWTARYAPFSVQSATIVLMEAVTGDRFALLQPRLPLGAAGMTALAGLLLLLFAVCLRQAVGDRAATPVASPCVALCTAYPAVLLALSAFTSLLVGRYFLPAVAAALILAAIGAGRLSRRTSGRLLLAVLVPALCAASLNQSLSPGWPRNPVALTLSGLILARPQAGTRVLINLEDDIGPAVQTQLLIDRLRSADFPQIVAGPDGTVALDAIRHGPVFLVAPSHQWRAGFAAALPAPSCLWTVGPAILAHWTEHPAPCSKPSE